MNHVVSTIPLSVQAAPFPGELEAHQTLVHGRRMHTLTAGTGEPLVLIHGLLGTAAGWKPLMRLLPGRIYAVDALGIGQSERVRGLDAGLEASARRLERWMTAEGLNQVDLVGTSHGGAVAMYFAALFPQRVRKMILHAPANPFCRHSRPQIRFACTPPGRFVARRLPQAPAALHRLALARMYGDPTLIRPNVLAQYVDSLRIPGTVDYLLGVLSRWQQDMAALLPLLPKLRALPIGLLWGEMDRAVSMDSGIRLAAILRCRVEKMAALGHLPFEEAPAIFASRLQSYFAELATTRQPTSAQRRA